MRHSMTRPLRGLALCLLLAATAQAAEVTATGARVELRGQIAAGDGERFAAAVTPAARTLRMRSPGGDMQAALAIARRVHEAGLEVEIDGLCASACAQFILPAARRVRASDGTLVAMHAVGDGALRAARREGRLVADDPAIAQGFANAAAWQAEADGFMASVGVRREAMDFMYELTSASDVRVTVTKTGADRLQVQLDAGHDPICRAWLLGPAELRDLGVRADDWSPGGRLKAGFVLGLRGSDLYVGPRVQVRPEDHDADCRHFRRRAEP